MSVPYEGDSAKTNTPGLTGKNTALGVGVLGESAKGRGVSGVSKTAQGVHGSSDAQAGVVGESNGFDGVYGVSKSNQASGVSGHNDTGTGVWGGSEGGRGVAGFSKTWQGVYGFSDSQAGVVGESNGFDGVFGISHSADASGISGHNDTGTGVWGGSERGRGVAGFSKTWQGVYGFSDSQAGVVGESNGFDGVFGISHSREHAAVSGHNDRGGFAGFFDGKVTVVGTVTVTDDIVLSGADCAEDFPLEAGHTPDPGAVMVIESEGLLRECCDPYDTRVAGVIAGAGNCRPGLILGREAPDARRAPLAMIGKVYCKVDASFGPITVGDMLTTSPTLGHAMKATDRSRAFGAIIGKALLPFSVGRGLLPILVAMQ